MVVAPLLLPPLMRTRPSARMASPLQNIWWLVVMVEGWVTRPVVRSSIETTVVALVLLNDMSVLPANVSSLLLGSSTAEVGTLGKPIGASHLPPTPAVGAEPRTSISAAADHGPRPPASVVAVSLT